MAGVIEGLIKVTFVCFVKDGAPDAGATTTGVCPVAALVNALNKLSFVIDEDDAAELARRHACHNGKPDYCCTRCYVWQIDSVPPPAIIDSQSQPAGGVSLADCTWCTWRSPHSKASLGSNDIRDGHDHGYGACLAELLDLC